MTIHQSDFQSQAFEAGNPAHEAVPLRRGGLYRNRAKRVLDLLAVLLAAPMILPVVLVLAALVALDGHKPFYSQQRLGVGGRAFRLWKLRSMVPDADALLEQYLAADEDMRREWDETQKLKNDPRITRVGRFIRKTSLDELPQLWNVVIGDMSLVGPRPMIVGQESMYPGTAYYRLRPGLTGPWQVSDRNESSFAARAGFDDEYEQRLSFGHDFGILLKTVMVVLRGTGH